MGLDRDTSSTWFGHACLRVLATWRRVVLPEPFGPTTTQRSPGPTASRRARRAGRARDGPPRELDDRRAGSSIRWGGRLGSRIVARPGRHPRDAGPTGASRSSSPDVKVEPPADRQPHPPLGDEIPDRLEPPPRIHLPFPLAPGTGNAMRADRGRLM